MNKLTTNIGYSYQTGFEKNSWNSEVVLYLPPDTRPATLNISVSSGIIQAEGFINTEWPQDFPAIFVPDTNFNPLNRTSYIMPQDYPVQEMTGGVTINLSGVNLPENKVIPIAFYAQDSINPFKLNLLRSIQIATDSNGRFTSSFTALPNEPIGAYYLVAITNPSGKVPGTSYRDGAGPYLGIKITSFDPCIKFQFSSSYIGRNVKVNPALELPLIIHLGPGKNSPPVGYYPLRTMAKIEGGPECVDKMAWWKISTPISTESPSDNITGWVADGNGTQRWLVDFSQP